MKTTYTKSDFDFELPEALIAQTPKEQRTQSRLLCIAPQQVARPHYSVPLHKTILPQHIVSSPRAPQFHDARFSDLPTFINPGDLLVMNDTRVIPARFFGRKPSGGKIEILVERVMSHKEVLAMVRASHSPEVGSDIVSDADPQEKLRVIGRDGRFFHLRFTKTHDAQAWLEKHGQMPLPPYIKRLATEEDKARYQTIYARHLGAVAAPTAGLHFDDALLNALKEKGVNIAYVTLHVGAGTFQPVKEENLSRHVMHSERYEIGQATADAIKKTREEGGRVIAVGTTSLRALESAADASGNVKVGAQETDLFIQPGYAFKLVNALVTNFHLPCSTLLMLVSAFGGYDVLRSAYQYAITEQYRFFSYGDAMFLERA